MAIFGGNSDFFEKYGGSYAHFFPRKEIEPDNKKNKATIRK